MSVQGLSLWRLFSLLCSTNIAQHNPAANSSFVFLSIKDVVQGSLWLVKAVLCSCSDSLQGQCSGWDCFFTARRIWVWIPSSLGNPKATWIGPAVLCGFACLLFCPCIYFVLCDFCETLWLTLKHLVTKKPFCPRHRWVVWVNKPFLTWRDGATEDDEWGFRKPVSPSLLFPPCMRKRTRVAL